jgi:hypothetical protein
MLFDAWKFCGACGRELQEVPDYARIINYNRINGKPLRDKKCELYGQPVHGRPHDFLTETEFGGVVQYAQSNSSEY